MHLGLTALSAFYDEHKQEEALVLATVIETRGSTYRKPGAMMLISAQGEYAGMISGGCLESDLLEHAVDVFESGEPKNVTYDMYADEQLVWSLGLGCDGVIILLLQRLDREDNFGFLPLVFESLSRRLPAVLALVANSKTPELPPGSFALLNGGDDCVGNKLLVPCMDSNEFTQSTRHLDKVLEMPAGPVDVLVVDIKPVPRVLICGAGPDAVPIAQVIAGLGWEYVVIDHRSHFANSDRFPGAWSVIHARPDALASEVVLADVDAVVIMSHHLENDSSYLEACVSIPEISYIGILGPASRRQKLLNRVDHKGTQVFGPVGLDIGAELPESIALSTVAEIHAVLNQRDGGSLTKC